MYGGGGGGGYIRSVYIVVPGNVISLSIGEGGEEGGSTGGHGDNTVVIGPGYTITAMGGQGSVMDETTQILGDAHGGHFFTTILNNNYYGIQGENGKPNRIEFQQRSATLFYEISSGGDGGNAGNSINTGGKGTYRVINTTGGVHVRTSSIVGPVEGGGGGAGYRLLSEGGFGSGSYGGNGKVTIHY
jgi:hypothetical protein